RRDGGDHVACERATNAGGADDVSAAARHDVDFREEDAGPQFGGAPGGFESIVADTAGNRGSRVDAEFGARNGGAIAVCLASRDSAQNAGDAAWLGTFLLADHRDDFWFRNGGA